MSDLRVCRICLNTEVRMFKYDRYYLKQFYEEVMGVRLSEMDGLPQHFCYECGMTLRKFHKFKEKCFIGQNILQKLLWNGSLTLTSITSLDREQMKLKSPVDILTVTKKVKTRYIKSKTINETVPAIKENIDKSTEIVQQITIDSDSDDDPLNNGNLNYTQENIKTADLNNDEEIIDNCEIIDEGLIIHDISDNENNDDNRISENESNLENKTMIADKISKEKDVIIESDKSILNKNKGKSKKGKEKVTKTKPKKFELKKDSTNTLDPKHWLKITLSEEEAFEEFRARTKKQWYTVAAYKCTDCLKGFSKEDMLIRHRKMVHSESRGPIVCRFCNMRFRTQCYLSRHITEHYNKYKCLRCDLVCHLLNTALLHNEYHNGVIRKCEHCGKEFRHSSTYYTHLRMNHRSEHVCTLCGASFVSAHGLAQHKRTMHINPIVTPEEEKVNTYCEQCDIKFETRKAYEEHTFHSDKHGEANLDSSVTNPKVREKKTHRLKKYITTTCGVCNQVFETFASYKRHHLAQHKDIPLPKDEQRHICEICGASLTASAILGHVNTHTRAKLYPCKTCGREFVSRVGLNTHQLTHSSVKPSKCPLCDKCFKQSSSMKLHYRTFHLKEPYPKRNRSKKSNDVSKLEELSLHDSEDNMTLARWKCLN